MKNPNLFNKISLKITGLVTAIFFLIRVLEEYSSELAKIDKFSATNSSFKLSSQFGFFEILSSARFSFIDTAILSFLMVSIPMIALVFLMKKCIYNETHTGWRRLAIAAPSISISILLVDHLIYSKTFNFGEIIFGSILSSVSILTAIAIIHWIYLGFKKP